MCFFLPGIKFLYDANVYMHTPIRTHIYHRYVHAWNISACIYDVRWKTDQCALTTVLE